MRWRNLLTVFRKEVKDNLRDKRAVGTAMIMPVLGPVLCAVALFMGVREELRRMDKAITVAVHGQDHAPDLARFLAANFVVLEPLSGDDADAAARAALKSKKAKVALVVSSDFEGQVRLGRMPLLRLYEDSGDVDAMREAKRVAAVLQGFASGLAVTRLELRGVSTQLLQPYALDRVDVAPPDANAALLLGVVPMILLMCVFIGGLYVAIDVTAGERERGTLEALLVTPVEPEALALGKLMAVALFAAGTLVTSGIGFALVPVLMPSELIDIPLRLDPATLGRMVAVCVPLVVGAAAAQMFVATRSNSFKEAQAALSYISLVPMLPSMIVQMGQGRIPDALRFVPIFSEQLTMNAWLRGESVSAAQLAAGSIGSAALSALFVVLTTRRFMRQT